MATLALLSNAAQNAVVGHETLVGGSFTNSVEAAATVQELPPFVDVTMSLLLSTATQSEADGQEMPLKLKMLSAVCGADQPVTFALEIVGSVMFDGAGGTTTDVASEVADSDPPALDAVTCARNV